jgi:hypothetical protein
MAKGALAIVADFKVRERYASSNDLRLPRRRHPRIASPPSPAFASSNERRRRRELLEALAQLIEAQPVPAAG